MVILTVITMFDDLYTKTHKPNHLATLVEQQAAAGASLPRHLAHRIQKLHHLTHHAKQLLEPVLGEMAMQCRVVHICTTRITLALPTQTATNYVRYAQDVCLNALRNHKDFYQFNELSVIVSTPVPSYGQKSVFAEPKKPLSENMAHTLSQDIDAVINNHTLKSAILNLIYTLQEDDDHLTP